LTVSKLVFLSYFKKMKAQPSWQVNKIKRENATKNENNNPNVTIDLTESYDNSKRVMDLTKSYDERRVTRKKDRKKNRRDPVFFVDIIATTEYENWLDPCTDNRLCLNHKGPFANLYWEFIANDKNPANGIRQVVVNTRSFPSEANRPVPQILSDLSSNWTKEMEKRRSRGQKQSVVSLNYASFQSDAEIVFREAEALNENDVEIIENEVNHEHDQVFQRTGGSESRRNIDKDSVSSYYCLLGMRAFKTPNRNENVFNILLQSPTTPLTVADFESNSRAQLPYLYANTLIDNPEKGRSVDDTEKLKAWLSTMPPQPKERLKGFKEGDAQKWVETLYNTSSSRMEDFFVLNRIMKKLHDPRLILTTKDEYNEQRLLQTDQEIIDSLPEQEFFTRVNNSQNAGKLHDVINSII
jgi:hypothetical protein